MVTIRLSRSGAKKKPFYHFTVTDSRRPRDSGYIERLGFFNPFATGQEIRLKIDHERLEFWLSKGAQTSDKVTNLVKESKMTPDQLSKLQEKKGVKKRQRGLQKNLNNIKLTVRQMNQVMKGQKLKLLMDKILIKRK